ncbi:TetR/AcrR family transcriptional regulator [Streptomyces sp. NPDC085937]|uniref:TetR/AcrR family transcriptional regulator n=1 Tax=Streptomyces sp. NPDC085937 TaxID=3365742 RepID=UPI0037CE07BD
MGRVSKAQAQENRQRVVETASRLFREQGTNVSVADLMKAVGLTHGGFYKQFASKEALVDEATAYAFEETADAYPPEYGVREVVESYLSVEHRDGAAEGCPITGFAPDRARAGSESEAHRVYTEGVRRFADTLTDDDQDGFVRLCTMVGALTLSRATKGDPVSEQILTAAREALIAQAQAGAVDPQDPGASG